MQAVILKEVWQVSFEECDEHGWCPLTVSVVADSAGQAIEAVRRERDPGTFGLRNFTAEKVAL